MAENLPQENFGQPNKNLNPITDRPALNLVIIAFFFIGLFLLALGAGLFLFKGSAPKDEIQIISADSSSLPKNEIVVDVAGAVVTPGVYRLSADSRVGEAVKAAGGLTQDADSARVNLAAKVADGQKIYVLAIGEQVTSDKEQVISQNSSLININTASESELDKLPGVGPVTAQKIIASRPYSTSEDLLTKKAVTSSVFEKIKDLITH